MKYHTVMLQIILAYFVLQVEPVVGIRDVLAGESCRARDKIAANLKAVPNVAKNVTCTASNAGVDSNLSYLSH